MTLKQKIEKMFNETLYHDEKELYSSHDFYNLWSRISDGIDTGGVQWYFEWYDEEPELSKTRASFINTAIDNFIKNKVKLNFNGVI